jgi:enamine deaminase RidA (YjgF/YER057c/UK114 family)
VRKSFFVACVLAAAIIAKAADKKSVMLPGANPSQPYSNAVWTGDFLYTAGTLGRVAGEGYLEGIEAQTRQTFKNLEQILDTSGLDLSRVVSVNVYLTDDRHYQAMNKVFNEVFPNNNSAPVRATVRTDLTNTAALIEISMVAVKEGVGVRHIQPEGWQPSSAGYAYGVQAGDTLFVAGLVSNDPATGDIVNGGIGVQAKKTLENLEAILKTAGMSYADVVSNRVYLRDGRDFQGMNDAYKTVFSGDDRAARATVRAGIMHPDHRIEIQSVAVRDSSRKVAGNAGPDSPFVPSVVAGKRQFLSGMTGRGSDGYAPGDVKAQTRQAIARLKATLEAAGLTLADVVDSRVFLTDIRHFGDMNEVYSELIPAPRPSRTTVGTALVSPDALVEIMFVADAER